MTNSSVPSIVVIDRERDHLDGLTMALERFGSPFLPLHFTGEPAHLPECPHVRLIFADFQLLGGPPGDHAKDFSVIGNLIENQIKPSGPYLLLLWTRYPDQAPALQDFLERREGVTTPVEVLPLSKLEHLDDNDRVRDREALVDAIRSLTMGWLNRGSLDELRGGWSPLEDHEVDALIEEIYAARRADMGRVVELED